MKLFSILVAIVALSVPVLSINGGSEPSSSELKPMPAINLKDLDGKKVDAKSFKGKIVVVDFWATWCGPCIKEIPAYNELQEKYADKGVKLIGVTLASGEAKEVKPFVAKHDMKYTVLMGDDNQSYDFNIMGFPTTILVTGDWKIYSRYVGAGPRKLQQLESDIQELLNQKNP